MGAVLGQLVHPDVDDLPAGREVNGLERGSAWPAHTDSRGARCLDQMLTNLPVLCLTGLSCSSTPRHHMQKTSKHSSIHETIRASSYQPSQSSINTSAPQPPLTGVALLFHCSTQETPTPPPSFPLEVLDISGTARRREGGRSQPPPCDGPPPVKRGTGAREEGGSEPSRREARYNFGGQQF